MGQIFVTITPSSSSAKPDCLTNVHFLGLKEILGDNVEQIAHRSLEGRSFESDDILLLDASIYWGKEAELLKELNEKLNGKLLLVSHTEWEFDKSARFAAIGFKYGYCMSDSADRLRQILAIMRSGESISSPFEEVRRLVMQRSSNLGLSGTPLTEREEQVAKLLSGGLTNKQIAAFLEIAYETVKEHVQNIFRKLGVKDRTSAAVRVARAWTL